MYVPFNYPPPPAAAPPPPGYSHPPFNGRFHRQYHEEHQRQKPSFCLCFPPKLGIFILLTIWTGTSLFFTIHSFQNKSAFFTTVPFKSMLIVFGVVNLLNVLSNLFGFLVALYQRRYDLTRYHRYVKISACFNVMVLTDALINCILFGVYKDSFVGYCKASAAETLVGYFSQFNYTSLTAEKLLSEPDALFHCNQLFERELKWSICLFLLIAFFYIWWTIFLLRELKYRSLQLIPDISRVHPSMHAYMYPSMLFRSPMIETPNLG